MQNIQRFTKEINKFNFDRNMLPGFSSMQSINSIPPFLLARGDHVVHKSSRETRHFLLHPSVIYQKLVYCAVYYSFDENLHKEEQHKYQPTIKIDLKIIKTYQQTIKIYEYIDKRSKYSSIKYGYMMHGLKNNKRVQCKLGIYCPDRSM